MFVTSSLSKKENAILRYFEKPFKQAAITFYFIDTCNGSYYVTLVRFLPGVGQNVRLEVAGGSEGFGALLAFVWPLTRVNTNVSSQIARAHERLGTVLALVWFLARVCQDVSL